MKYVLQIARQAPEDQSGAADGTDVESMGDQRVIEPTDPPLDDNPPASQNTDEQSMGDQGVVEPGDQTDLKEIIEGLEQRIARLESAGSAHDRIARLEARLKHFL